MIKVKRLTQGQNLQGMITGSANPPLIKHEQYSRWLEHFNKTLAGFEIYPSEGFEQATDNSEKVDEYELDHVNEVGLMLKNKDQFVLLPYNNIQKIIIPR
jgi:hypothetical protein